MLWSKLFIPTLRDESQPLLARAGYIRGSAHLYLGQRVLRKMEGIVREEMIAMGAQEFGAGRTCSIWRASCGAIGSFRRSGIGRRNRTRSI